MSQSNFTTTAQRWQIVCYAMQQIATLKLYLGLVLQGSHLPKMYQNLPNIPLSGVPTCTLLFAGCPEISRAQAVGMAQ